MTIMYAVQNDTEIKFNIVLYIKVILVGQGWVYKRPITAKCKSSPMMIG